MDKVEEASKQAYTYYLDKTDASPSIPVRIDYAVRCLQRTALEQTRGLLSVQTSNSDVLERIAAGLEKNNELLSRLLTKMEEANRVTTMEEMYRDSACVDTVQLPDFTDDTDI